MGQVRYSVVIEWDERDEVFVATVPAFPVATQGKTWEEARANAEEAILVTVEGFQASGLPLPAGDGDKVVVLEVAV